MAHKRTLCKPVIGITVDIDGEYSRLKRQYASAVINAGGMPLLMPSGNDPRALAGLIDGLLLPGGGDIDPSYFCESPHPSVRTVSKERTEFEISLLREVMGLKKPVFGICYGMQLINVAMGGTLYQDIGSQVEAALDHCSGTHPINIIQDSGFRGYASRFVVNSSHHQAVKRLGSRLEPFANSDDGIVEAIYSRDYPFLMAVQWHPERSEDEPSLSLLREFVEAADGG